MLVYLNALTWTGNPEALANDIRAAQRIGVHLQPCHEFASVLDPGSQREALAFKEIMEGTPPDLKAGPTNIYSQIAIALKGGDLRQVGLVNLAARIAERVPRLPIVNNTRRPSMVASTSTAGSEKEASGNEVSSV